jgi:hypothetical protein
MANHTALAQSATSSDKPSDSSELQKSDKVESYGAGGTGLGITRQTSSFIAGIQ